MNKEKEMVVCNNLIYESIGDFLDRKGSQVTLSGDVFFKKETINIFKKQVVARQFGLWRFIEIKNNNNE
jgi:hypothetical protein